MHNKAAIKKIVELKEKKKNKTTARMNQAIALLKSASYLGQ